MKEYLNRWLWIDLLFYKDEFQEINKLDLVNPLDVETFKANPSNSLFECIGIEGDYLIIKSKNCQYRIKKEAIKQIMPSPKYNWDEIVLQLGKPDVKATISDFFWHQKDQKYYYTLIVDGKKKSRRYSENELKSQI